MLKSRQRRRCPEPPLPSRSVSAQKAAPLQEPQPLLLGLAGGSFSSFPQQAGRRRQLPGHFTL